MPYETVLDVQKKLFVWHEYAPYWKVQFQLYYTPHGLKALDNGKTMGSICIKANCDDLSMQHFSLIFSIVHCMYFDFCFLSPKVR
jgi:hypothetical protein